MSKNYLLACKESEKFFLMELTIECLTLNYSGHFDVSHKYFLQKVTILADWNRSDGNLKFLFL